MLSQVTFLDKLLFTKHLSVMLKSGIPLLESLEILSAQHRNPAFKKVLASVQADTKNGQSLEKSLSRFPGVFDPLYTSIIGIGEESGNLDGNLEYLASQLGKTYEFSHKVRSATMYPTFILIVAAISGTGISLFVLPQLTDLFESLDVQLPVTTRLLLAFSRLMKDHGLIIFSGLLALALVIFLLVRSKPVRPLWHRLLLSLPLYGRFLRHTHTASFCRNLGILLKSSIPITRALKITSDSAQNLVFKGYILRLVSSVDTGKSLEAELSGGGYPLIPPIVTKMIGVGERSGKLGDTLIYLAEFFEEEVDDLAKNLSSILEPVLLVVIALIVAFMAMAIITPIYQFTGAV